VDKPVSVLIQYGAPVPGSKRSLQVPGEPTVGDSCFCALVVPTVPAGEVGRTSVDKPVSMLIQYGAPVPASKLSLQPLGGGGGAAFFSGGITPELGRISVDKPVSVLVQYGAPVPASKRSLQVPDNSIITAGILLISALEVEGESFRSAATCCARPCHNQAATLSAPSMAMPIRGNTEFCIGCKNGCRCVELGVGRGIGASNCQAFVEVSSHFCNSTGAPFRSPSLPWTSMHSLVPLS